MHTYKVSVGLRCDLWPHHSRRFSLSWAISLYSHHTQSIPTVWIRLSPRISGPGPSPEDHLQPDVATTIILPSDLEGHACVLAPSCGEFVCLRTHEHLFTAQCLQRQWNKSLVQYTQNLFYAYMLMFFIISFPWLCVVNAPRCGSCYIFIMLSVWWQLFPILFNQSQMFLSHLLTPTHQLHVCLHCLQFLCFHSVVAVGIRWSRVALLKTHTVHRHTHTHTVQKLILSLPLCQGLIFMGSVLYFNFN